MTPRTVVLAALTRARMHPEQAAMRCAEIERALADAGFVIVPRVPTEAMELAAIRDSGRLSSTFNSTWAAMIDAFFGGR